MAYKLENVSAKISVSIRKAEQLLPDIDLKHTVLQLILKGKVHRMSFSDFCLVLRELHAGADMDQQVTKTAWHKNSTTGELIKLVLTHH